MIPEICRGAPISGHRGGTSGIYHDIIYIIYTMTEQVHSNVASPNFERLFPESIGGGGGIQHIQP